jgi:hypothetical protein
MIHGITKKTCGMTAKWRGMLKMTRGIIHNLTDIITTAAVTMPLAH